MAPSGVSTDLLPASTAVFSWAIQGPGLQPRSTMAPAFTVTRGGASARKASTGPWWSNTATRTFSQGASSSKPSGAEASSGSASGSKRFCRTKRATLRVSSKVSRTVKANRDSIRSTRSHS